MTQLNLGDNLLTPPDQISILKRLVIAYKLLHTYLPNFPRTIRFTLGEKLDLLLLKIMAIVFTASKLCKEEKLPLVQKASTYIDHAKFFLQIAWEMNLLDDKKYARISEHIADIGKMTGGWIRQLKANSAH